MIFQRNVISAVFSQHNAQRQREGHRRSHGHSNWSVKLDGNRKVSQNYLCLKWVIQVAQVPMVLSSWRYLRPVEPAQTAFSSCPSHMGSTIQHDCLLQDRSYYKHIELSLLMQVPSVTSIDISDQTYIINVPFIVGKNKKIHAPWRGNAQINSN